MIPSNISKTRQDLLSDPVNILSQIPEELLWRANFNSQATVSTYDDAIKDFVSFLNIRSIDTFRQITHAHVIAYKNYLLGNKKRPATIQNRLSALSSLFNHLIDKQMVVS